MTKSITAEVCILKNGQVLQGTDVYGKPCIMIVGVRLMTTLTREFHNLRYDAKEKILYLKVTGNPKK